MKRTREKTEIMEEEEIRSQMFDSEVDDYNEICIIPMFYLLQVTPAMRAGGSRVVCEPSYVPVENLVFGRLAFKGMNQEIEAMMAEKAAAEENTNDKEVSDGEMASRLSKNMAKKFATKRDNAGQPTINKSDLSGVIQLILIYNS